MGLRINNNINSIIALGKLQRSDRQLGTSIERLSSGLRINKASDDPAGLVISEQLRAQVSGLEQAVENTSFSSNLIGTAEAALQEVSDLLIRIRDSAILAGNTGGLSSDQIQAEQDSVDSAINAIDRVASTTRFAKLNLLNGASDFVTSGVSAGVTDSTFRSVYFGNASTAVFTAVVTQSGLQARLSAGSFTATGGTIRVTGSLGTEDVVINSSITSAQVASAIHAVRDFTGIFASGAVLQSDDYGSNSLIRVEVVNGTYTAGADGMDTGQDIGVTVNGAQISADGLDVRVNSKFLKAELRFHSSAADGVAALTSHALGVRDSGLTFQLGGQSLATDELTVGVHSVRSQSLGFNTITRDANGGNVGGFLSSLVAGGSNDISSDPENAVRIVDEAIDQVNSLRSFLGAIDADTLQPNARALSVAIENLTASESMVRDLDFADETAAFTRAQVLFNAGTSVLATANLLPQTVLGLLG
jgi:flagellin